MSLPIPSLIPRTPVPLPPLEPMARISLLARLKDFFVSTGRSASLLVRQEQALQQAALRWRGAASLVSSSSPSLLSRSAHLFVRGALTVVAKPLPFVVGAVVVGGAIWLMTRKDEEVSEESLKKGFRENELHWIPPYMIDPPSPEEREFFSLMRMAELFALNNPGISYQHAYQMFGVTTDPRWQTLRARLRIRFLVGIPNQPKPEPKKEKPLPPKVPIRTDDEIARGSLPLRPTQVSEPTGGRVVGFARAPARVQSVEEQEAYLDIDYGRPRLKATYESRQYLHPNTKNILMVEVMSDEVIAVLIGPRGKRTVHDDIGEALKAHDIPLDTNPSKQAQYYEFKADGGITHKVKWDKLTKQIFINDKECPGVLAATEADLVRILGRRFRLEALARLRKEEALRLAKEARTIVQ